MHTKNTSTQSTFTRSYRVHSNDHTATHVQHSVFSRSYAPQRILKIIRTTAYSHDHTQLALVAMAIDERVEDLLHDLADAVVANHRHLDERVEKG